MNQKIVNLLKSSENEYSKFSTRKWYVIDSKTTGEYSYHDPTKSIIESIESSPCNYSDAHILVTGNIVVTRTITAANTGVKPPKKRVLTAATQVEFKTLHYLKNVGQKSMILLLMKQIRLILQCVCTIWLNIMAIILILLVVYRVLKEIR